MRSTVNNTMGLVHDTLFENLKQQLHVERVSHPVVTFKDLIL